MRVKYLGAVLGTLQIWLEQNLDRGILATALRIVRFPKATLGRAVRTTTELSREWTRCKNNIYNNMIIPSASARKICKNVCCELLRLKFR